MRKPFQSFTGKPAVQPTPQQTSDMLDAGLAAVRARIEKRFADEGVALTDSDVTAVVVGISAAISQAEEAAITAVLHLKRGSSK